MKTFDYKARMDEFRKKLDAEVAAYIFGARTESYATVGTKFGISDGKVKQIAKDAGIVRGHGWRPSLTAKKPISQY